MASPKLNSPVCVHWVDAVSYSSWHEHKAAIEREPVSVQSVGWLIRQDKSCLTLATSLCGDGDKGQILAIPANWVKKVTVLK